jgi:HAD superfamily hydrolase (TIGR01490 family)
MHRQYMQEVIQPLISTDARALVEKHRAKGDTLMIITATNRFITGPIAEAFGIQHLLATEPEKENGKYTGHVVDIPCFQDGKVKRLDRWLTDNNMSLANSWFYSDSHNDIPLLEKVTHPVAVDPDDKLRAVATQRNWQILSLHHGQH